MLANAAILLLTACQPPTPPTAAASPDSTPATPLSFDDIISTDDLTGLVIDFAPCNENEGQSSCDPICSTDCDLGDLSFLNATECIYYSNCVHADDYILMRYKADSVSVRLQQVAALNMWYDEETTRSSDTLSLIADQSIITFRFGTCGERRTLSDDKKELFFGTFALDTDPKSTLEKYRKIKNFISRQ